MEDLLPEPRISGSMDSSTWTLASGAGLAWARALAGAGGHKAQAATGRSQDAGANIVEGEKRAIRLARIFKN